MSNEIAERRMKPKEYMQLAELLHIASLSVDKEMYLNVVVKLTKILVKHDKVYFKGKPFLTACGYFDYIV